MVRALRAGALLLPRDDARVGEIRDRLSLPNPAFIQHCKAGLRGPAPPERIDPLVEIGSWVAIPREADLGLEVEDRTVYPPAPPLILSPDLQLRPYQAAVPPIVRERQHGVVVMPPGAGKTITAVAVMGDHATPWALLAHTNDLLVQTAPVIERYLGVKPGMMADGKREDGAQIVLASFQTLMRMDPLERMAWGARFGGVIIDECHHLSAECFGAVLTTFSARIRVGLSATPIRHDGLTDWIFHHLGPVLYEVPLSMLEREGRTLRPTVRWVPTGWSPPADACDEADRAAPAKRKAAMAESERRNRLILDYTERAVKAGRSVIVLADLVEHCKQLAEVLVSRGVPAAAMVGSMTSKRRKATLEQLRSGELRAVVATSLADEGLDVPRLDTCILATPCPNLAKVQQRIGRVLRPHPDGQPPVVLDLVDGWGPYQGYARRRRGLYLKLGWSPPRLPTT